MEEQKLLKKQFILHIAYNMVAFSIIFFSFGIFMFFMIRNLTFSSVDKQLQDAKNQLAERNVKLEILYRIFDLENLGILDNRIHQFSDYNLSQKIDNPQIMLVIRDQNQNILNADELGRMGEYLSHIAFDEENLDQIYTFKLDEKYNYRALNFLFNTSENSQNRYVQLIINVDSEIGLMNSYMKIISYAVILGILLSGIASLILSTKTLRPIQETLRKQTEFVQNASHELRTPLTIIQAKQELLLREPTARIIDKSEEISLTLNETKRLSKLTKDLMILLRGSNLKLQREEIGIDDFLKNITIPYRDIAAAQGKQIILNLNFAKVISVDTNKIHQLMVILLDNAIKYTENGDKIKISTYLKDNKCILEVADTGIGISDEGLNRIFDRFYREDKARSRETGGSGLGLSIATMIVNAHGGTIKAIHNKPKGTIFLVKFNR